MEQDTLRTALQIVGVAALSAFGMALSRIAVEAERAAASMAESIRNPPR